MNTEEKLLKLKKLADAMYYAAQYLTTDASRLHKAMDEYHKFIIHEYHKEEPTIPDIVDEHYWKMLGEEPVSEDFEKIVEEIAEPTILNAYGTKELARRLRNTICDTSVSEDLEEASKDWLRPQLDKSYANYGEVKMMELTHFDGYAMLDAIEFGAKWQKASLWKPADGYDLPEIDREVIALLNNSKVVFAHRPNPEGWDGKSVTTGKVEHYTPKTYDKGDWNQPDVKYWLDVELPKEIEL